MTAAIVVFFACGAKIIIATVSLARIIKKGKKKYIT